MSSLGNPKELFLYPFQPILGTEAEHSHLRVPGFFVAQNWEHTYEKVQQLGTQSTSFQPFFVSA